MLDFLGKGIAFPFRFSADTGGVAVSEGIQHVSEGLMSLIYTCIGERIMHPAYGASVRSLVSMPNSPVLLALIRHRITDAIATHEKRVVITRFEFDGDTALKDQNVIRARIEYRIINTQITGNLVYPFYLDQP